MMHEHQYESLIGWIEHLTEKYAGLTMNEIARLENIHLMIELLDERSYEWIRIKNTTTLIINATLSDDEKLKWLIGGLAEHYLTSGKYLMIRASLN
jgi:hypothetical protein